MVKVGITGGIGSGKTTVCRVFEILGVPVFNADDVAKSIMITNPTLIKGITERFGTAAYFPNGELNRKYLSGIVFQDAQALQALNELVHPAAIQAFKDWSALQSSPYCLHEAAILFESGAYKTCDYSILVSSPENIRMERVMKRDGITREKLSAIMNKQMPEEEKAKLANFVIENDEVHAIIPQVLKLHQFFLG